MTSVFKPAGRAAASLAIVTALLMGGCRPKAAPPAPRPPLEGNWPTWRVDQGQSGCTDIQPPAHPALRWTFTTGGSVDSSPVVAGRMVYVGSGDGFLYALDLSNGTLVWRYDTSPPAEPGGFRHVSGVVAAPLVHDGRVYFGDINGTLHCLDAATGAKKWTFQTNEAKKPVYGSANWAMVDGVLCVLVCGFDMQLHCVQADNGEKLWTLAVPKEINGSPAVDGDKAAFGGCDGTLHIVSLTAQRSVADLLLGAPIPGWPAIQGGEAFVCDNDGLLLCADMEKGRELWTLPVEAKAMTQNMTSPAVSSAYVVFGTSGATTGPSGQSTPRRELACVNRATRETVWIYRPPDAFDGPPLIAGRQVLVGCNDGRLYNINLADGSLAWTFRLGDWITTSPALAAGLVIVGCQDGNVYALEEAGTAVAGSQ